MIRLYVAGSSVVQPSSPSPMCIQHSDASILLKNTPMFFSASMVEDLTFLRNGFGGFPYNTSVLSSYIAPQKINLTREIIRMNIFLQNACATYFLSLNNIWIFFRVAGCVTRKYMPKHLQVCYILQSICSLELMGIP